MKKFDGIIFDFDGTLFDSMHIWEDVGNKFLLSHGVFADKEFSKKFKTLSLMQASQLIIDVYAINMTASEVASNIIALAEDEYLHKIMPKKGVVQMLESYFLLGVKMCIATACDRHLITCALKRTGLEKYFLEIFTCSELGCGKDEPKIFDTALKFLQTQKTRTAVFEDSLFAIETLKKANFYVVGIYDLHSHDNQQKIKSICNEYYLSWEDFNDC